MGYRSLLVPLLLAVSAARIFTPVTSQFWFIGTWIAADSSVSVDAKFGTSLVIFPKGDILVVGAPYDSPADTTNAGSIGMYTRSSGSWVFVKTISSTVANSNLGLVLAATDGFIMSGSYLTSPGKVYPVQLQSGQWAIQAAITAPSALNKQFGKSLVMDATLLVVGDPQYAASAGGIFMYTLSAGSWAYMSTATVASSSSLGNSVALSSSLIAATVIDSGTLCFSTHVWGRNGLTIDASPSLVSLTDQSSTGKSYGYSISIAVNTTLVLGCENADGAIAFTKSSGSQWAVSKKFYGPMMTKFGYSIAASYPFIIIGAPQSRTSYVALLTGTSSTVSVLNTASNINPKGSLGTSVAFVGNFLAVGDPSAHDTNYPSGAFVPTTYGPRIQSPTRSRSKSKSVSAQISTVIPKSASKSEDLGYKAAIQDGVALVSVPFCAKPSASCDGGYVLRFEKVSNNWGYASKLRNPFFNRDIKFGYSMPLNNNYLIVAATNSRYISTPIGISIFYKWDKTQGVYIKDSILRYRNATKDYNVGEFIANFNNITVIGTPEADASATAPKSGFVHIFKKVKPKRWRGRETLSSPMKPTSNERFGSSVSIMNETRIAVSNRPQDVALQAVYVFDLIIDTWTCIQTLKDNARLGFGWISRFLSDGLYISAVNDVSDGNSGSISIYTIGADQNYQYSYSVKPTTSVAGERFGFSFASDGVKLAVGSSPCDEGKACSVKGSAYTFVKQSEKWKQKYRFSTGRADGTDGYGFDVAVEGDTVIVTAPFNSTKTSRKGIAYFIVK